MRITNNASERKTRDYSDARRTDSAPQGYTLNEVKSIRNFNDAIQIDTGRTGIVMDAFLQTKSQSGLWLPHTFRLR